MKTTVYVLSYSLAGLQKVVLTKEQFDYFLQTKSTLKETCIHFAKELGLNPKDIKDIIM